MNRRFVDDVIDIGPKDRAVLVGSTTSGKTTLARHILPQYPYVVAADPKGTFRLPNARVFTTPDELRRAPVRAYEPQIYRPRKQFWDIPSWDEFFEIVYERQNTTLYVDEVYGVVKGPVVPLNYRACITRGAELHIRVISATQRPSRIPLEILTESEHYILFGVRSADDLDRMEEYMGDIVQQPLTVKHSFYYYRVGEEPARIFKLQLEDQEEAA